MQWFLRCTAKHGQCTPLQYAVDDQKQRVKDLEALVYQERQEAQRFINDMRNWNEQQLEEKQKVINALERTLLRMQLAQENEEENEPTCGSSEWRAPVSASTPRQSVADDPFRVSMADPRKKEPELHLDEFR